MRILHVEHPDGGGPGVFAEVAPLETWRAWEQPPPDGEVDAIVVYGGSNDVRDAEREPWLRDELLWLGERIADGVPVLGLCLGGQLAAAALGADVTPAEPPEIGWYDVELTAAGRADPVLGAVGGGDGRFTACQWHSWTFAVPEGAELLATSPVCAQAFRHGRTWGVQFHPEVDAPTYRRWIDGYDADPAAVSMGFDPVRAHREADRRMPGWNATGRLLFAAFVAQLR